MADKNTERALIVALVIAALTTVAAFFGALHLLQAAYRENPEYSRWQMLPDEEKNITKEDGQPVHPRPQEELPLTESEIIVLGAGMASFAFLPAFFGCYIIIRRRK